MFRTHYFRTLVDSSDGTLNDNYRPPQPLNGRTVYKRYKFYLTLNIPAYMPPYSYRGWTNLSTNCIGTMSALTKKNVKQTFLLLVI